MPYPSPTQQDLTFEARLYHTKTRPHQYNYARPGWTHALPNASVRYSATTKHTQLNQSSTLPSLRYTTLHPDGTAIGHTLTLLRRTSTFPALLTQTLPSTIPVHHGTTSSSTEPRPFCALPLAYGNTVSYSIVAARSHGVNMQPCLRICGRSPGGSIARMRKSPLDTGRAILGPDSYIFTAYS